MIEEDDKLHPAIVYIDTKIRELIAKEVPEICEKYNIESSDSVIFNVLCNLLHNFMHYMEGTIVTDEGFQVMKDTIKNRVLDTDNCPHKNRVQ